MAKKYVVKLKGPERQELERTVRAGRESARVLARARVLLKCDEGCTDEEVVDGIRLLARTEGIFAETAGGVTVAVLRKLLEAGRLDPDADTVVFNTGEGLKTLDAVAPVVGPAATIPASADAFTEAGLG